MIDRYQDLFGAECERLVSLGGCGVNNIEKGSETMCDGHPALKRQDRLGKEPFAGFGTVVEDITESGYTKNQPILLGFF